MYAFCTYCSRDKSHALGDMPAIQRYLDERIRRVHAAAAQLGLGFYILSGEYGLVPPEHPIPWYDHLLNADEVNAFVDVLAAQILEHDVAGVVCFTEPFASDPNVVPYHDALVAACGRTSRPVLVVEIEPPAESAR